MAILTFIMRRQLHRKMTLIFLSIPERNNSNIAFQTIFVMMILL